MFIAPHTYSARSGARTAKLALTVLLAGTLAACGAVDRTGRAFWQPYRPNVQQGNWITQQQIALLRPGMTREQVRFALGTPTLTPIFHSDRWEYPYYMKPGYGETEERRFTVYFDNNVLVRWEGDEQPRVQPFQDPASAPAGQDLIGASQGVTPAGAASMGIPRNPDMATGSETPPDAASSGSAGTEEEQPKVNNRAIQLQQRQPATGSGVNSSGSVPLR